MKTLLLLFAAVVSGYGQNATRLQNRNICIDAPQKDGDVLTWSAVRKCWVPKPLPAVVTPPIEPPIEPPVTGGKDIKTYGAKCDGSDDTAAVQKALNELTAGSLNFSCVASVSQVALSNRTGVTVYGSNGGGIKLLTETSDRWNKAFSVRFCSTCIFRDLLFEGSDKAMVPFAIEESSNATLSGITIRNVGQASAAFVTMHNKGNKYSGFTITNVGLSLNIANNDVARGAWFGNVSDETREDNATISGFTFSDINGTAVAVHGSGNSVTGTKATKLNASCVKVLPLGGSGSTLVANNNCSGAGSKWQIGGGIMTEYYNSSDETTIIRDNVLEGYAPGDVGRVQDSSNNGVAIANPASKLTRNVQVIGNTIRNFMYDGIQISSPIDGYVLEANTIERTFDGGNQWNGIAIQVDQDRRFKNGVMRRNKIRGKVDGILLAGSGNGIVDGLLIEQGSTSAMADNGLHIEVRNGGQVVNLTLTNNCYAGVAGPVYYDNRTPPLSQVPQSPSCP